MLERFAYELAMSITHRSLFYSAVFGAGLSCDLATIRARVFRFVQEVIRSTDPKTGITQQHHIYDL